MITQASLRGLVSGERSGRFEAAVGAWYGRDGDILQTVVYRRRVTPAGAWLSRSVRAPFDVVLTAHAWRGRAIDGALDRFVADLGGDGAARVVAYVGHNGWMDRAELRWPTEPSPRTRGSLAIACMTRDYLERTLAAPTRVPLLLTTDLLFAGSHALEGAVDAFANGGAREEIRMGAARAYADGEKRPLRRVERVFSN